MHVLFLGGTGNISSDCAARLHALGHVVTVVSRGHQPVPDDYRKIVADCRDRTALQQALGGQWPDVAINFLGYEVADVEADYQLFRDRLRQYIFISSATVYAKPPARLPITEDAPLGNAWWDYARKKLACENWLRELGAGTVSRDDRSPLAHLLASLDPKRRFQLQLHLGRPAGTRAAGVCA